MSYVAAGYSRDELRHLWRLESELGDETALALHFGRPDFTSHKKPPYRFLLPDSDPQSLPAYNELQRPDFVDEYAREYTLKRGLAASSSLGEQQDESEATGNLERTVDGTVLYVRIPKGGTALSNREMWSVIDSAARQFPAPGDRIVLSRAAKGGKRSVNDETVEATVQSVRLVGSRRATAEVILTESVLSPEESREFVDDAVLQRRLDVATRRQRRRLNITEEQAEQGGPLPYEALAAVQRRRPQRSGRASARRDELPGLPGLS